MLRRRHIDAGPGGSRLRTALAAVARPFRAVGWAIRERLLWPVGDLLRSIGELLKWPFQRLGWGVERRLLWPSRERIASWGYLRRIAGTGALVAVALGATALGVLLASQEEPADKQLATATGIALSANPQVVKVEKPAEPALRGAPPVFKVKKDGVKVANESGSEKDVAASQGDTADQAGSGSEEESTGAGATTSKQKPVPAGPAAMKVARRFTEAFVFYEVGKRPQRAKTVFQETASSNLADALIKRPPRLPENAKVPKARVVNLVPGPRRAKTYTISASLLRVGVTSELRLSMKKEDGAWVITDVRG